MVSQAIGDKEIPVAYLLGEQYVKAMQDMAVLQMPRLWSCSADAEYHSRCDGTSLNFRDTSQ